ncbi:MAG: ABC transporter permease [Treponema sp.]|nr:ABC transporter permease [Treponema sp.]
MAYTNIFNSNKYLRTTAKYVGRYSSVLGMLLIFFVFTLLSSNFLSVRNINNILSSAAPIFFVVIGLSFVILTGSVDLSTGGVVSCTCVIVGLYIGDVGNKILWVALAVGIGAGLLNGLLISMLKIPSFIGTLCTYSIWKCVALVLSGSFNKAIPLDKVSVIAWSREAWFIFPVTYLIALGIYFIALFIERYTTMGKSIYAVGANVGAARMAGISIVKAQIAAYLMCGIGSALCGACYALRTRSSYPSIGDTLNLLAMAAVVMGGTSLAGGKGTVATTLPSVITMVMLQTALKVLGLDAYWQEIVFGIVLLGAIYINADRSGSKDVIIK